MHWDVLQVGPGKEENWCNFQAQRETEKLLFKKNKEKK